MEAQDGDSVGNERTLDPRPGEDPECLQGAILLGMEEGAVRPPAGRFLFGRKDAVEKRNFVFFDDFVRFSLVSGVKEPGI